MTLALLRTGLLALAIAPQIAGAADDEGRFAVDGIGARSCADFAEAFASGADRQLAAYASWADGFASAYNAAAPRTYDVTPWQTVELLLAKVDVYCENHPDTAFVTALGQLLSQLAGSRLIERQEMVSVRAEGQAVFIYRETLDRVRAALAETGHAPAGMKEHFGPSFSNALRGYQEARGLPQTGLPDQSTLNALFP